MKISRYLILHEAKSVLASWWTECRFTLCHRSKSAQIKWKRKISNVKSLSRVLITVDSIEWKNAFMYGMPKRWRREEGNEKKLLRKKAKIGSADKGLRERIEWKIENNRFHFTPIQKINELLSLITLLFATLTRSTVDITHTQHTWSVLNNPLVGGLLPLVLESTPGGVVLVGKGSTARWEVFYEAVKVLIKWLRKLSKRFISV